MDMMMYKKHLYAEKKSDSFGGGRWDSTYVRIGQNNYIVKKNIVLGYKKMSCSQ